MKVLFWIWAVITLAALIACERRLPPVRIMAEYITWEEIVALFGGVLILLGLLSAGGR